MHWSKRHPDRYLWTDAQRVHAEMQTQAEYEALYGRGGPSERRPRPLAIRDQLEAFREGFLRLSHRQHELWRLGREASWWRGLSGVDHWTDHLQEAELLDDRYPSALLAFLSQGGSDIFSDYLFQRSRLDDNALSWWQTEIAPQMPFVEDWSPELALLSWKNLLECVGRQDCLLQRQASFIEVLQQAGEHQRVLEFTETPVLASGPISIYTRAASLFSWQDDSFTSAAVERIEAEIWWQGLCGIARGSTRCPDPDRAWAEHRQGAPSPLWNLSPIIAGESLRRLVRQTESLVKTAPSQKAHSFGSSLEREWRSLQSLDSSQLVYSVQQVALASLS